MILGEVTEIAVQGRTEVPLICGCTGYHRAIEYEADRSFSFRQHTVGEDMAVLIAVHVQASRPRALSAGSSDVQLNFHHPEAPGGGRINSARSDLFVAPRIATVPLIARISGRFQRELLGCSKIPKSISFRSKNLDARYGPRTIPEFLAHVRSRNRHRQSLLTSSEVCFSRRQKSDRSRIGVYSQPHLVRPGHDDVQICGDLQALEFLAFLSRDRFLSEGPQPCYN